MAHFYGTINGQSKTTCSRRGGKNTGLKTIAASWQGAVEVTLQHDEKTGKDTACISLIPWRGRGVTRLLYCGPVDDSGGVEVPE